MNYRKLSQIRSVFVCRACACACDLATSVQRLNDLRSLCVPLEWHDLTHTKRLPLGLLGGHARHKPLLNISPSSLLVTQVTSFSQACESGCESSPRVGCRIHCLETRPIGGSPLYLRNCDKKVTHATYISLRRSLGPLPRFERMNLAANRAPCEPVFHHHLCLETHPTLRLTPTHITFSPFCSGAEGRARGRFWAGKWMA